MITATELVGAVRDVAARYPERTIGNEPCYYIFDDCPVCLLGHALIGLGVEPDSLLPYNTDTINQVVEALLPEVGRSPAVVDWLRLVQENQDRGWKWSTAVKDADWSVVA